MKTVSKPVVQSSSSAQSMAIAVPKFDAGESCLVEAPKPGRQEPESDRDTAADSDACDSPITDSDACDADGRDGQFIDPESGLILHTAPDGLTSINGTTRRLSPERMKQRTLMVKFGLTLSSDGFLCNCLTSVELKSNSNLTLVQFFRDLLEIVGVRQHCLDFP